MCAVAILAVLILVNRPRHRESPAGSSGLLPAPASTDGAPEAGAVSEVSAAIQSTASALEADKIQAALTRYRGNRTLAARHLGTSRVTLWKKIKEFGIS